MVVQTHTDTQVVHNLIPYAHVADPARSIDFYRRLGFVVEDTNEYKGRLNWASLRSGEARLMIALATAPINPHQQAVLFYLYTRDVVALREQLLADGIAVGEIQYPPYMASGEFRVEDPDGYCLLICQIG
ncbi:MAG: VOC family protein [Thermomicrobiales bacterium]